MENQELKIEKSIIGEIMFHFSKDKSETYISGWDLGGRIYVVERISDNRIILKVKNCNVLCGARGCGMVMDFPTKYYLGKILDKQPPEGYNWDGYIDIYREGQFGRNWKQGINQLKQISYE